MYFVNIMLFVKLHAFLFRWFCILTNYSNTYHLNAGFCPPNVTFAFFYVVIPHSKLTWKYIHEIIHCQNPYKLLSYRKDTNHCIFWKSLQLENGNDQFNYNYIMQTPFHVLLPINSISLYMKINFKKTNVAGGVPKSLPVTVLLI